MVNISLNGTTRRERRILRQRQDIMDAAARLFAVNGYAATTTKDIAEAVDVGESTLYSYFPGKQEIMLAIFDEQNRRLDTILKSLPNLDFFQSYINFVDMITETLLAKVDYTRALIGEAWINDRILNDYVVTRGQLLVNHLEKFITSRIESGDLRQVDPRMTARIMIATFIGALLPVLRGVEDPPDPGKRKELSEAVVRMLADGIAHHPRKSELSGEP